MTEERPAGYLQALSALQQGLDALPARWTLLGGAAVVALGVPRYTADIDATVLGGDHELVALIESLKPHGLIPRVRAVVAEVCEALEDSARLEALDRLLGER